MARAGKLPETSRWTVGMGSLWNRRGGENEQTKLEQHPVFFSAPTVVLVLVFGICWAPFHIERLMWSFMSSTEYLLEAYQYVHIISGVFFYLSSAANPVLYSLMSTRFQDTFREALCLGTRCRGHRRRHSSHSLSRVTTGSTLCDMGSLGSRAHPLAENYGLEGQEETDPSLHRGDSQQLHLEAPEGHL